ncbi:hypothetical protein E2C01_022285 [Portunus trituberculatus]|uniref:Uncharacterized protein n=1 Tax=Portunus trituberculatus TaxID=210409 RepID=A0A5B7E5K8_PORTR|nr:hypothetical protein [Portunus trituberculatus]
MGRSSSREKSFVQCVSLTGYDKKKRSGGWASPLVKLPHIPNQRCHVRMPSGKDNYCAGLMGQCCHKGEGSLALPNIKVIARRL